MMENITPIGVDENLDSKEWGLEQQVVLSNTAHQKEAVDHQQEGRGPCGQVSPAVLPQVVHLERAWQAFDCTEHRVLFPILD